MTIMDGFMGAVCNGRPVLYSGTVWRNAEGGSDVTESDHRGVPVCVTTEGRYVQGAAVFGEVAEGYSR